MSKDFKRLHTDGLGVFKNSDGNSCGDYGQVRREACTRVSPGRAVGSDA